MCEILEAVCSILPRKVPGSCKNCAGNQQGLASSGATVSYALCEEEDGKRGADPQCRNISSLQLNICQNWMEKNPFCLKFTENVPQNSFSPHCPSFKIKMITLFSVFSLHSVKHTNAARMQEGIMFWMCSSVFFSWEGLFYDLITAWPRFVWRIRRQFNWIFYFIGRI